MIGDAADFQWHGTQAPNGAAEISMEFPHPFRRNPRLTVLGAENQVDFQAQVGRRHDASLSRTLRGAIRKSRKSGGNVPG